MKIFKKKETVVPVDENGNPIETEKKKIDWKKVAVGIGTALAAMAVGTLAFVAVGIASGADSSDDDSSDEIESAIWGNGTDLETSGSETTEE